MKSLATIAWKGTVERFLGSSKDSGPTVRHPTTFDYLVCVLVYRATEARLTARMLEYIVDGFCTSLGAGPDDATIPAAS